MDDYFAVILRAVRALDVNTKESRRAVYERARTLMVEKLSIEQVGAYQVANHRIVLDKAISRVEAEESQRKRDTPEEAARLESRKHKAQMATAPWLVVGEHHDGGKRESKSSAKSTAEPSVAPTTGYGQQSIFVSYQRDESAGFAGRIFDRLVSSFSREQIFMDVDNIEPGLDFVDVLNERVGACEVLLAVIGPSWSAAMDSHGTRRLDDPHDFVRIEVEAALQRKVRVIPILVTGSRMPRPEELPESMRALTRRQAFEVSHAHFNRDVDGLIRALKRVVAGPGRDTSEY